MDVNEVNAVRDGIFALRTRRFGTVAEIMVKKLYNLDESKDLAFDKLTKDTNERIEIKFSTVRRKNDEKITEENVIEQCKMAVKDDRPMLSSEVNLYHFDSNIQQIKRIEFEILYYGLFFWDRIEIYKITRDEILNGLGYSDKQHRRNRGEGQFHVTHKNIQFHRKNFLQKILTYDELYKLLKKDVYNVNLFEIL